MSADDSPTPAIVIARESSLHGFFLTPNGVRTAEELTASPGQLIPTDEVWQTFREAMDDMRLESEMRG